MSPKVRVRAAWVLLIASVVAYPVCAFTIAKDEPPVVLFLSFFAITLTAIDIVGTQDVRRKQED